MAVETARTRTGHPARGRVPAQPRRVSGPLRPAPAGAPPLRRGVGEAGRERSERGAFERLRALPETRVVDGLLRGRAWIWLIGLLLGGIVAMQVSLLKLNAGISRAVTTSSTLERTNADIEAEIARLESVERVRATAAEEGMVMPLAGDVTYLSPRPGRDAVLASRRMQPPSDTAAAVMANGGREPGVVAPVTTAPQVTAPAATTTTTTTATPAATATPVPTVTPDPTAAAVAATG
jgi:hypothetical protein